MGEMESSRGCGFGAFVDSVRDGNQGMDEVDFEARLTNVSFAPGEKSDHRMESIV